MARGLAEAGADLVLVGRDAASLEAAAADLAPLGRRVEVVAADVGVPGSEAARLRAAVARLGPIDILVNNVGGRRIELAGRGDVARRLAAAARPEPHQRVPLLEGRRRGDARRGPGGRVINVASICGLVATRGIGGRHYETAKAALIAFTRAVAADWAPRGVTVNAIAPGGFLTDPNRRWFSERTRS